MATAGARAGTNVAKRAAKSSTSGIGIWDLSGGMEVALSIGAQVARNRQYKHPKRRGVVTIPGKLNADLAVGTLRSILKAARIQS